MGKEPFTFSRVAEELIGDLRGLPDETPKGMKRRPTLEAGELVQKILVKHQIGMDVPEDAIRKSWTELVGPANAHFSHPVQIDPKGILLVLVSHAVVKNELYHHRQAVVEKIRALPGCEGVKGIHLRHG
ncbi:MAG: DciA family protein [Opitutaceae bacterium]|nr:DciA family protein [Opitutaceae bacterium]